MKDYVGRTDSVFNECHGWCRAETGGDKRLESRIQSKAQLSLSSRGIQIFLLILGEHGPFLFSMKSVRVRQVQLESLRLFLNFRMELHFLMLSVLSSCTSKGVVLDQETHEMGINFNSSWTALTLGEDTG